MQRPWTKNISRRCCAMLCATQPVSARLVQPTQDWRWSSARAHLRGNHDGGDRAGADRGQIPALRFIARLERLTGQILKPASVDRSRRAS